MGAAVRTSSCRYWGATEGGSQGREQPNRGAPGRVGAGCPGAQSPNLLLEPREETEAPLPTFFSRKLWTGQQASPGQSFCRETSAFPTTRLLNQENRGRAQITAPSCSTGTRPGPLPPGPH